MQITDTDDPIDIRYDNVFKAVFTKNTPASKGALSKLISALIKREITITAITANEPASEDVRNRQIRFDINCKAKNGELINVEMSLDPNPFEPVRLEYYVGKLFSGQDIKGIKKTYNDLKQTYQITILAQKSFFNDKALIHSFEYYDPEHKISLNGRSRIITMELSKMYTLENKPTKELSSAENWATFFQYLTDKAKRARINEIIKREEGIAMASKVLMTISRDEAERARLMSELKYQLDTQSKINHARQEGKKEGKKEGIKTGIKTGEKKIIDLLKSGKTPEEIIKDFEN